MTAPATADGVTDNSPELTPVKLARRRWAKSDATQERILDAAAEVFRHHGFTTATIGEVVAASGSSIGSIYHHFGGKSDLFLAIHQRLSAVVGQRIIDSPAFDAQARGYLEAIWTHRNLAAILSADDVPPGYEGIRRDGMRAWIRDCLDVDSSIGGALLIGVLVAVLTESAAQVMACDDDDAAVAVMDAAVTHLERLLG